MSYVLFSQTSSSNGTRDRWDFGQTTSGDDNFGVGSSGDVALFDYMVLQNGFSNNNTAAAYTLDFADFDNSALGTTLDDDQRVLGSAGNVGQALQSSFTNAIGQTTALGYGSGALSFGLADGDWNDIKNFEVFVDSGDQASVSQLNSQGFVDNRIKVGDSTDLNSGSAAGVTTQINVGDTKRGQIDASESSSAVDVNLAMWTNGSGWSNKYDINTSAFGDDVDVFSGEKASGPWGKGAAVAGLDNSLNTEGFYDGRHTTINANLGLGDDQFDSRFFTHDGAGAQENTYLDAFDFRTTDNIKGGSGNDTILTGAGNDTIHGDGANPVDYTDQSAANTFDGNDAIDVGAGNDHIYGNGDTGTVSYGASAGDTYVYNGYEEVNGGNFSNWVGDGRMDVSGQGLQSNTFLTWQSGVNDSMFQGFRSNDQAGDPMYYRDLGFTDLAGTDKEIQFGNPVQSDNVAESEVLRLSFDGDLGSADIRLSFFYQDFSGAMESATMTLQDNGSVLGDITFAADGTILGTNGLTGWNFILTPQSNADYLAGERGIFKISVEPPAGTVFDTVELESAGRRDANGDLIGDGTPPDQFTNPSAFQLHEVTANYAGEETLEVTGGDTLTGGAGDDTFHYAIGSDGVDTITDFLDGNDTLLLTGGTAADVEYIEHAGNTLVNMVNTDGGILLLGVDALDAEANTVFA